MHFLSRERLFAFLLRKQNSYLNPIKVNQAGITLMHDLDTFYTHLTHNTHVNMIATKFLLCTQRYCGILNDNWRTTRPGTILICLYSFVAFVWKQVDNVYRKHQLLLSEFIEFIVIVSVLVIDTIYQWHNHNLMNGIWFLSEDNL